jgi:SAM-dependent methyltransferase
MYDQICRLASVSYLYSSIPYDVGCINKIQMDFTNYKKDFWDSSHSNESTGNYVTDLSLDELCQYHKIDPPEYKCVLDIGVGYGRLVYELANKNAVYAADISTVAIERVRPFCSEVYLSSDINKIPPVDLAISHLVLQHNPEDEVFRIINDVNLKENGIFTFQIATLNLQKSVLSPLILEDLNRGMLHFYSPAKISEIIQNTNKELISVSDAIWHDAPYLFEWYIIKVKNKN